MKRVKLYTLGCKTNQYETQAIREDLVSSGRFVEAKPIETADLYVVNTCTVTAKADRDSRWRIRHCHKENPLAEIVVTGCLAEMDEDMITPLPGVSYIIKNNSKDKIMQYLLNESPSETTENDTAEYTPLNISYFKGHTKAFIKIQDGCDNLCSYCKVRLARGKSRSRRAQDIARETEELLKNGFKELVLTGICLGSWGKDLGCGMEIADLLDILERVDKDFRIRLSSIEPNMVSDRLLARIARSKKICHHLHIPLQSGSDRILRSMKRPYTRKEFRKLVMRIKKTVPGIAITTDVMVGFPGETEKDFKETCGLIKEIVPARIHIFSYSRREHTAASKYEGALDKPTIKRRKTLLEKTAQEVRYRYKRQFLRRELRGLVETRRDPATGFLTGYTDRYIRFLLDGPDSLMGRFVSLKMVNRDEKANFFEVL